MQNSDLYFRLVRWNIQNGTRWLIILKPNTAVYRVYARIHELWGPAYPIIEYSFPGSSVTSGIDRMSLVPPRF
jgi:hypothetical protein